MSKCLDLINLFSAFLKQKLYLLYLAHSYCKDHMRSVQMPLCCGVGTELEMVRYRLQVCSNLDK